MIPTMKPRVMRTQVGLSATSPLRPASPYDPSPWARSATQTTAQEPPPPGQSMQQRPAAPLGQPGRVQTANTGQQSVGSSYAAGSGLPQVFGGSVAASPRPTLRSPMAQSALGQAPSFAGFMAGAGRAATSVAAARPTQAIQMPQQAAPAVSDDMQGDRPAKGPRRQQQKAGGVETGSSSSGLAADTEMDGEPGANTAEDTPGNEVDLEARNRARMDRANNVKNGDFYVDEESGDIIAANGDVLGNVSDDAFWEDFTRQYSQAQGPEDVDLSQVPTEYQASVRAVLETGDYWVDERTGELYLKDKSGAANPEENHSVGNIYTGEGLSGRAAAIWEQNAGDDGKATVEEILQQILDMQPQQQTDAALQAKIAADRQERQYAAAQALQASMAAGGRARMGAGWMAGQAGDIGAQAGLAQAQGAADLRLEHDRQNLMARIDMVNRQIAAIMAMAGYADNDAARAAAAELARQQQDFQMQLNDLNYQRSQTVGWKDIFGLGGNLLGGAAGGFVNWMMRPPGT